jgi:hypothetical protein
MPKKVLIALPPAMLEQVDFHRTVRAPHPLRPD